MMLTTSGIRFAWPGGAQVLDGVDLEVGPGELVALVGANGSGKSTLLRILAGILRPEAGRIEVVSRPLESFDRGARARTLAYLPQVVVPLYPMSARQMVALARHPWPDAPGDSALVEKALADCDALGFADRPFDELSGGERQRVLLAGALAQGGQVLLLDEPTAALDLPHAVSIFARLREQIAGERCALVVTHDLNLAAAWADRVILLHEGVVLAAGAPRDVLVQEALDRALGEGVEVIVHPRTGGPRILPRGRGADA